jgi:hypothetical protein
MNQFRNTTNDRHGVWTIEPTTVSTNRRNHVGDAPEEPYAA